MECFAKKADTDEFHQQLKIAQDKDKTIQKIQKMSNTMYVHKDFHGGGKITSLICFKEKIVIPGLLQKHVINWYHTTLCHPGINRTEETIEQHLWWPKMRAHITNMCKFALFVSETREDKRSMDYSHLS
jgi:Integrase zinc binding domain